MADEVIAKEQAEKEFEDWCEACGIDCDVANMDDESASDFTEKKKRIIKACMSGLLVFDDGNIVYTISNKSPENFAGVQLKIGQPSGKLFTAMDGLKDTQLFKKQCCVMSAMTGKDNGFFEKLHAKDFKLLQTIAVFFLTI